MNKSLLKGIKQVIGLTFFTGIFGGVLAISSTIKMWSNGIFSLPLFPLIFPILIIIEGIIYYKALTKTDIKESSLMLDRAKIGAILLAVYFAYSTIRMFVRFVSSDDWVFIFGVNAFSFFFDFSALVSSLMLLIFFRTIKELELGRLRYDARVSILWWVEIAGAFICIILGTTFNPVGKAIFSGIDGVMNIVTVISIPIIVFIVLSGVIRSKNSILKGAVIGAILAGETGAIIGAISAKNKQDRENKKS